MFPAGTPDPEYPDDNGVRKDKRNLVQEWQAKHQVMGAHGCGGSAGLGLGCWANGLRSGFALPGSPLCVEPHGAP